MPTARWGFALLSLAILMTMEQVIPESASGDMTSSSNADFWPTPRHVERRSDWMLRLPVCVEAPAELAGPAALLKRELVRLFGDGAVGSSGKTPIKLRLAPEALPRDEEYSLETSPGSALLRAHDHSGAFWAVHSLLQRLSSEAVVSTRAGYRVPGVKLSDWPENQFRAFMIQGPWSGSVEELKRNLDLLARMKVRYVALEFGPRVILDFDPSIAEGARLTKAQAREIIDYGRSLGLEPIVYLNMLGHLERAYKKAPTPITAGS